MIRGLARFLREVDGDAIDRDDRVPPAVIAGLKRLGVFRMRLPRAYGGLGLSHGDYHRAVALIAARSAGLAMWVTTHESFGAGAVLALHGAPEQRAWFLPRLAAGELSALAVTEAESGGDPSRTRTSARPVRGGAAYRLHGRKLWVTNGPVARWVVVLARAPGGLSVFLVDARSRGFRVERRCRFLGLRGMENGVLRLSGVIVPAARRVGAEGEGLKIVLSLLTIGRLSGAARALGLARECRRIARTWTRRFRGGRRLDEFEAVSAGLRRLEWLVRALEAVSARAAALADQGRELRRESALAKLFAASAAWEAADIALRLRGARGYETADSQRARGETPEPVERLLRDARGLRLIEGGEDVLRLMLARGDERSPDEAARRFAQECLAESRK